MTGGSSVVLFVWLQPPSETLTLSFTLAHRLRNVRDLETGEPLAAAVRGSGGRVHAGERIARERVELAWAHRDDRSEEPNR